MTPTPPKWKAGLRRSAPWILIVVATLVVLVSSLAVWVNRQALDEDAWADASRDLIEQPEVRSAVATYMVDELFTRVDVSAAVAQALPENAKALSPLVAAALADVSQRLAEEILARPRVEEAWVNANRAAHRVFMAVVDEEPIGRFQVSGNEIVLDLRPLLLQLGNRFGVADRIPADAGVITVAEGDNVDEVRTAVNVVRWGSVVLGLLVLALFAAAVYLAPGRRRIVLRAVGISLLLSGIVLLVIRRVAGDWVVDAFADQASNEPVGRQVWVISTTLLRDVAVALMIYGVLVILGAALAGPSRSAVWLRRRSAPLLRAQPWAAGAGIAVLVLLFLLLGPGGGQRRLLATLVLAALVAGGVTVLWKQILRENPGPPAPV